jgi:hypothetical protein
MGRRADGGILSSALHSEPQDYLTVISKSRFAESQCAIWQARGEFENPSGVVVLELVEVSKHLHEPFAADGAGASMSG